MKKSMSKNSFSFQAPQRKAIAAGLAHVLADTFRLYQKTHAFHWNVEGPNFSELHALFQAQYQDLWASVDVVAERIRALGHYVPASNADFSKLSVIKEEESILTADAMVLQLAEGHEQVVTTIHKAYNAPEKSGDVATTAMYDERLQAHEKHIWMLRAHLKKAHSGTIEKAPLKKLMD